jgi:hypothetical protein
MEEAQAKHRCAQIRKQEGGHKMRRRTDTGDGTDANDRLMGRRKEGQREMSLGGSVRDLSVTLNHFPEMGWLGPDTSRDVL